MLGTKKKSTWTRKYTEQKYKCKAQQFQRFYWVTVHLSNQSIEINELGPNLVISRDWEYRYASVGHSYLKRNGPHNGPQDLVTVFLCIQISIDKMQLCLLSIANACPYHNPTSM